jgi:hypothetical protein
MCATIGRSSILTPFVPYLVNISLVGLTASMFGLGATLSNFLGQQVVESFGHVTSLTGSLILSFIPVFIFAGLMPETLGDRGSRVKDKKDSVEEGYVEMR